LKTVLESACSEPGLLLAKCLKHGEAKIAGRFCDPYADPSKRRGYVAHIVRFGSCLCFCQCPNVYLVVPIGRISRNGLSQGLDLCC